MSDLPVVTALHLAPRHHAPTEQVDAIAVEAGRGVVGDRYHGSRHRHVSVQSAPSLAEAAGVLGAPVEPGATRRTVTVSDGRVPTEPGAVLRLGDPARPDEQVVLEVVRVAAPCALMETSVGPGAKAALRRRAGSVLRALTSGTVRVGDPVKGLLGD
ncbi:MOSC domain-containing protein [Nocardioides bruguierae]|uniref:MOSC domain-containing protein n=1 Tax=Nocardioides bruguierae TaxID=2945102 RepID=A0A9X2IFT7_9ACTN|nr:MOSC domain-containing protein [Nocardioides bruguierae]MCM0621637.1 MOSC domain-containing protein [Nocardioides bruguierae]